MWGWGGVLRTKIYQNDGRLLVLLLVLAISLVYDSDD